MIGNCLEEDIIGLKRLHVNTSYNLEYKFTLQHVTPVKSMSPSYTLSTFTTLEVKEIEDYKINILVIIWGFYDSYQRGNFVTNFCYTSPI